MTNQIWQVQDSAANGSQSTAGNDNTIKFSLDSTAADTNLYGATITLRNSTPENTDIQGESNDIEDMGIDGVDIKITAAFRNVESELDKLVDWWKEDKFATGFLPGRFGLELNFPTRFNVEPTSTYGYQIVNPVLELLYEKTLIAGFNLTLRLGGAVKDAI